MGMLEVRNLRAGYGRGDVVRDIDLNIAKGELDCTRGANGSGKSTLVKALQGLLKDVTGEVSVDGDDLFQLTRREVARKIAFVPQVADLTFEFSVLEVVAMGRYSRQGRMAGVSAADRRIIQAVLGMVGRSQLQEKKVAHLSGGERQRVLFARALAQDTPLLCLDEPRSPLDLTYGLEVFPILEGLQKET